MNASAKYFDKCIKCIHLLVNDTEILEKYDKIWNKIKSLLKKELLVKQCIMINILKLKQKFTMIEYIQFFVALLYSILVSSSKEYYPQIFSEECKFAIKNRKIIKNIIF